MGNETSGFAVLNLSSYNLHIGLRMAALHYYENNVKHGEIFYRRPGAVHYTVFAQTAPELSDTQRIKEIVKASLLGVVGTGAAAGAVLSLVAFPALSVSASSLALAVESGAVVGASAATDYIIAREMLDVLIQVPAEDLQAKKMGCYGGGSGTWLVLRGGLQNVNGELSHAKLFLEKVEPEYVLENGMFTTESYRKFYAKEEARMHNAAGHNCSRAGCRIPS